ncbi:MAG: hypothetical protein WDO18_16300 [Acidobacteriota bacterium]
MTERQSLEFRAELYNVFNRANFSNPPAVLSNSLGTGTNQLQPGQRSPAWRRVRRSACLTRPSARMLGWGHSARSQLSLRYNF